MASTLTGTIFSFATVFAAAKTISAISNASEAVVSCTGHGYSAGDIVEVTTGWGRINKRAFKVKTPLTDSFVIEGENTLNTDFFPVGSSSGSVRKVTTWQQISKIMNPTSSGGESKSIQYKYVESDVEYTKNDGFTATQEGFEIDADELGSAGYNALKALSDVQTDTIMKKLLKSGSVIYTPCTVALNENVSLQDGQINKCKVSISGNNRITRY